MQPISTFSQTVSEITVTPVLNPLCAERLSGRIPRRWEMTDALTKKIDPLCPVPAGGKLAISLGYQIISGETDECKYTNAGDLCGLYS
ncbi:hypothetical protein, partial [Pantoea vagans]|uniref:hypothetical protein n=1 Tax=Pantoea vagans TaxID=470934 RepID=UPI0028A2C75A